MKRLALLVALGTGVAALLRRRRGDEADHWHEATTAPDLR
ncbi:MAG TPA: DLW-39 family protein [Frankiaceae bacterium]|jgi:hypothetical protein